MQLPTGVIGVRGRIAGAAVAQVAGDIAACGAP
jgi:hypothetical protein